MKTVETAFQHLADSRLVEDTFTCERGGGGGEKWEARGKLPSHFEGRWRIFACEGL